MSELLPRFNSIDSRIGIISALFLFYVLVFIALGNDALGLWPEVFVQSVALGFAVYLYRMSEQYIRVFFLLLAVALFADVFNVLFMQTGDPQPLEDLMLPLQTDQGGKSVTFSFLLWGVHLFLWDCAWALLAFRMSRQLREGSTILAVTALLSVGIVFLIVYQLEIFAFDFKIAEERFHFLFLVLQLFGVLLGLMCVLMGLKPVLFLLVAGFTIGTANNVLSIFRDLSISLIDNEGHGHGAIAEFAQIVTSDYLDPVWVFGRALTMSGLVVLPLVLEKTSREARFNSEFYTASRHQQSNFGTHLLMYWLISVAVAMSAIHYLNNAPHFLVAFLVLYSAICVASIAVVISIYDSTLSYTSNWISELFSNQLNNHHSDNEKPRPTRWLNLTAMNGILNTAENGASELRDEVIFLGPERLNRPASREVKDGDVTAFLVMPFSASWSDSVTQTMRDVCKNTNVRALRGDDMFRPTDILDDIWSGIIESDFIIAEITGLNANVFYELGMAHAIGKPVIILAQDPDEVPFDLKTRRVLIYSPEELHKLQKELESGVSELLEYYELGKH